jgi:transcriptional regulator with PAS, ATPase and Fis domain
MADGGTLFLDEIGELPLYMQSKILRALQEKQIRRVGGNVEIKVDVRIIAATNKNLEKCVSDKTFREDLFYRLNTLQIQIPSLSERSDDIVAIGKNLLKDISQGFTNSATDLTQDATSILCDYNWPGNVRELRSVLQRAALICNGPVITGEAVTAALGGKQNILPFRKGTNAGASVPAQNGGGSVIPLSANTAGMAYHKWKKDFMHNMEKSYLQEQLSHFGGNVSAMSRTMKVSRPNLCRLLKKHGLLAQEFRKAA